MWQDSFAARSSAEVERSSTPPNLQKKFNPYDILTPQKAPLNVSLLDLGTADEATCITANKFSETALDLTPVNKSKGFDYIDLYQNILVTPQLVNNHVTIENDIDFNEFFDKLESGKKYDWSNINSEPSQPKGTDDYDSPITNIKSFECNNSRDINVFEVENTFVKTHYRGAKQEYYFKERKHEYKSTEEDIIEEVILDKTLEKIKTLKLSRPKEVVKVLPTPNINLTELREYITKSNNDTYDKPKIIVNDTLNDRAISQELLTKNIQKNVVVNETKTINDNHKTKIISDTITQKHTNQDLNKELSLNSNMTLPELNKLRNSNTTNKFDLSALHFLLDDNKMESNAKKTETINRKFALKEMPISSGRMLENQQKTMPKDAKHFAKYSLNIDFTEQIKQLTPGPTYEEKIIALPSILERLNEQKRVYEYRNNLKRRLILDEGRKRRVKTVTIGLEPVVLKEDCNNDRLQSFVVSQMFGKFVKNSDPY